MATSRYANPGTRLFDSAGNLLSNGKIYFYSPGTTTEKAIYTTSALSTERANPVILSGSGLIPEIWMDGEYDVVVQNSSSVQVDTGDDVNPSAAALNLSDWSSTQNYPLNAVVKGSDGNVYISAVANNLNNDPITTVGTSWNYFFARSAKRGLTAGTTQTQGGATAMTASINEFSTVANTDDGGKLPSDTGIGERVMVVNNGANDMQVWPASGDSIDDGATNAVDPDAIAAGSSRLYTRQTATKWSADKAVVANTTTAVASGALANGDTVIINAAGTVSAVSGSSYSAGTAAVFESASTSRIASCFDSSNSKIVVCYADGGNSNYGTAVVGTVSGSSISFGTPVVFESNNSENISCAFDSSNNKVVIAYREGGVTGNGFSIVGTVSGTAISFGSSATFEAASTTATSIAFDSTNNKVVIAYRDTGNSNYGTAIVGTVSGTSISFGTPAVFESAEISSVNNTLQATFDSNSGKVVIAYRDVGNSNYGTAVVGTVSGTGITFGTPVVYLSSAVGAAQGIAYDSTNQKAVISYTDGSNGSAIVGTVSGTSISFGSAVVFEAANADFISSVYDSSAGKIVISYKDVGNSSFGTVVAGTVSGTSISFETPNVFESALTSATAAAYDGSKVVISYADVGNSTYGTSIVTTTRNTNVTSENFVGFSDGVYSDAATATIQIAGAVDDAQSGLTPGQKYYVQDDGSISLTEGDPSIYAGIAKSSTEIIVKG